MKDKNFFKNLSAQLSEALPSHIGAIKKDFEKKCQAILSSAFNKFNLVTRDEFDTQSKVLIRTRKKLEEIETHLKELERLLKQKSRK